MKNKRLLLRALIALTTLAVAGCTADLTDTPVSTGNALTLANITIGAPTRAEAIETGTFMDGDRLDATLTLGNVASRATYLYNAGTWSPQGGTPAYWQNTTDAHGLTLRTPAPEPAMPAAFTADNWHEYDELAYTGTAVRPGTTDFTLSHTRAQLCVVLTPGTGMTADELATATVALEDGTTLWHNAEQGAHYALHPADNSRLQGLTITVNGNSYTYTNDDPATATYIANRCIMLTLRISKAGVESLGVTSTGWQQIQATATENTDITFLNIATPGTLQTTWEATQDIRQVRIAGTLNATDLSWLGSKAKDELTTLWIDATCPDNTITDKFARNDNTNGQLQTLILPHITTIGSHAFRGHPNLSSVFLPKVTRIDSWAFYTNKNLHTLSLPEATYIGNQAFNGCDVEKLYLPKVKSLADRSFYMNNLSYLSLPEARSIGDGCFNSRYTFLTVIYMPKAESIGDEAFNTLNQPSTVILNGTRDGEYFLPTTGIDIFSTYSSDTPPTLLLCGEVDEEMFTTHQEAYTHWGGLAWSTVYYGLRPGADPEDPASYTHRWPAN